MKYSGLSQVKVLLIENIFCCYLNVCIAFCLKCFFYFYGDMFLRNKQKRHINPELLDTTYLNNFNFQILQIFANFNNRRNLVSMKLVIRGHSFNASQNFPKNKHFLPMIRTRTYVSWSKK